MLVPSSRVVRLVAAAALFGLSACVENVPPSPEAFDLPVVKPLAADNPERIPAAEEVSVRPTLPMPMPLVPPPMVPPPMEAVGAEAVGEAPIASAPTLPSPEEALAALAADGEVQRFLLLRRLVADGLVTAEDLAARRAANLGALLPFSAPPPADGLDLPLPDPEALFRRIAELTRGSGSTRLVERDFLLEGVMPLRSRAKAPPVRTDGEALRDGRLRIDRLAAAALVAPPERDGELAAIARGDEVLANLPPPPPPKVAAKKKGTGGGMTRSRGLTVIPTPAGAMPLEAGGPMGIHLLSMASPTLESKAWEALRTQFPDLLGALEHKAVKTEIPELGTTYRLLAGPLSQADAEGLCRTLRTKGQSCSLVKY